MKYGRIPGLDKEVSRIILGTASQAFFTGSGSSEILDAAKAAGINTIDTARNYGASERWIGQWLKERGCREEMIILSKCGHPDGDGRRRVNEREIREDFAESSRLLGTDHIDIYLLHRDDPDIDAGVAVEVFNAMRAEGKIGVFGGSNWTWERIEEANEYAYKHGLAPFSVSSPHFGLARQQQDPWGGGCVTLTGAENADARAWYVRTDMPVVAYSSLGRGVLSGKLKSADIERAGELLDPFAMKGYGCADNFDRLARCEELAAKKNCSVAQLAMAWIYHQPLNVFAVATMSSERRIRENIEALDIALTEEECRYLNLEQRRIE